MPTEPSPEERDSLERLVGSVVSDKYRVDKLIGRGGMGAVFQATNLSIGKRVALKFLNRDAAGDRDAAERFQREAMAASVVESAHIVHIFDSGTSAEGLPFLVMELLAGEDLRTRLKREQRLPVTVAVDVASQVLRALRRAHAAGLVHRDLKPDNVFLCQRDDDALFVKIVDFGISKLARGSTLDTLTRRGTVLGTAFYMSPEQAQAFTDIDGRTDLFSVGAILYECLAGQPPHVAPTYEAVLIAICTKDPPDLQSRNPDVSDALARVIRRALARERDERFSTADEFLEALASAVPGAFAPFSGAGPSLPSAPQPSLDRTSADGAAAFSSTSRRASLRKRNRIGTWVTAIVAVLAGFALTAVWMGRKPGAQPEAASNAGPISERAAIQSASVTPAPAPSPTPVVVHSTPLAAPAERAPNAAPSARAAAHRSQERRAPAKRGVASELELSTREP